MLPHSLKRVNEKTGLELYWAARTTSSACINAGTRLSDEQNQEDVRRPGEAMDLKQVVELLGGSGPAPDDMTTAFLEATFSSKPTQAATAIRQLQASDPCGFLRAAVSLLAAKTGKSPGLQYVAGLVTAGNLLIDPLLDENAMPLDSALSLARNLAAAEPILDARLLCKLLSNAGGEVKAIPAPAALRVLTLTGAISDCSRLTSFLIQFLRHPSPDVRSKAALLLGRANLNLPRVRNFLNSSDARVRANAVESLWGHDASGVEVILREAVNDTSARASINALLALCRAGDGEAFDRLCRMAGSQDPLRRGGAAWAMGESGAPEFAASLDKLAEDENEKVRAMAQRSRKKLREPNPEGKPALQPPPV